jgi:hypothetical protein
VACKFSRVERKVWRDELFCSLSGPKPNAQTLFLYLLTCDAQGAFPGLYVLRLSTAAEDLRWPLRGVKSSLAELEATGKVVYDTPTSTIWLPNAPRKRVDEVKFNSKNAKGWRNAWDDVPRSSVAQSAWYAAVGALVEAAGGNTEHDTVRAFSQGKPSWLSDPRIDPRIHLVTDQGKERREKNMTDQDQDRSDQEYAR